MMMGFGGMGMAVPWLLGGITVAAIWVGVWWLLSAIGMTGQGGRHGTSPGSAQLPPATWEQPPFAIDAAAQPEPDTRHQPMSVRSEGDYR